MLIQKNLKPTISIFLFVTALAFSFLSPTGCALQKTILSPEEAGRQKAVSSLLSEAQAAMDNNRLNQAEIILERAVRIEPSNALLWHAMAKLKFHQHEYPQTINFCLKSNSLIANQKHLQKENLLLMKQAYFLMGDYEKANNAQRQADNVGIKRK